MSVIKVSGAYKVFELDSESNQVLKNFCMNVTRGSIYSLMGASGCGKTTLISCLVGLNELDSGEIEIFGKPPQRFKSLIGYMPQKTALVEELKVREIFWFHGTIYGLSSDFIEGKMKFLSELLELPEGDQFVRNCSGGEKRRISFAVSLLHDLKLLILDEPTVGCDPVLRANIWDYLEDLTRNKKVTVLLSTHYPEEAKKSSQIGFMRNGVLLAEDKPKRILDSVGAIRLDDAFITFSLMQEYNASEKNQTLLPNEPAAEVFPEVYENFEKDRKQLNFKIVVALMTKNFLQIIRHFETILTGFLLPILICFIGHFAVGAKLQGLTLGIVNNEVATGQTCFGQSLSAVSTEDFKCRIERASCRFINEFDGKTVKQVRQVFYKSHAAARKEVVRGKIIGFVEFSHNFSQLFKPFNDDAANDFEGNGLIQAFLDQSDFQKNIFIKREIYENYQKFIRKLMVECGKSDKAAGSGINFKAAHGHLDLDFRNSMIPNLLLGSFFSFAATISATSIVSERVSGTWNRVLVSGVKPIHFLLAQLIEGLAFVAFHLLVQLVYLFFILMPFLSLRSIVLSFGILLLNGFAGLLSGLLCSIVMKTSFAAFMVSQFSIYPPFVISGLMWPVEGMPLVLKYFAYLVPFTLPTMALRNILTKESPANDKSVVLGFVILAAWNVSLLFLCFKLLRDKPTKSLKSKVIASINQ